MDHILELDAVDCRYAQRAVVRALTLRVRRGSFACLLGPSGCGKTTALRAIAGFEPVHSGSIRIEGRTVSGDGTHVAPERRGIGMVFQDYALFPHLTVIDNVCFGLGAKPARERLRTGHEMLELVGLAGEAGRYPDELSGGQQQRVALARALAPRPALVLLDEPFSSLDVDLRERLASEVHDILKGQGITAVLVTHDQHEAFAVGEQIGVMRDGALLQWDTPFNLYHEPAQRFVADFIGHGRFVPAVLRSPDTLETAFGLVRGNRAFLWPAGTRVQVLLRPDDVVADAASGLRGRVTKRAFKGAETLYTLRMPNGQELLSLLPSHLDHQPGEEIGVRVAAEHLVAFREVPA